MLATTSKYLLVRGPLRPGHVSSVRDALRKFSEARQIDLTQGETGFASTENPVQALTQYANMLKALFAVIAVQLPGSRKPPRFARARQDWTTSFLIVA